MRDRIFAACSSGAVGATSRRARRAAGSRGSPAQRPQGARGSRRRPGHQSPPRCPTRSACRGLRSGSRRRSRLDPSAKPGPGCGEVRAAGEQQRDAGAAGEQQRRRRRRRAEQREAEALHPTAIGLARTARPATRAAGQHVLEARPRGSRAARSGQERQSVTHVAVERVRADSQSETASAAHAASAAKAGSHSARGRASARRRHHRGLSASAIAASTQDARIGAIGATGREVDLVISACSAPGCCPTRPAGGERARAPAGEVEICRAAATRMRARPSSRLKSPLKSRACRSASSAQRPERRLLVARAQIAQRQQPARSRNAHSSRRSSGTTRAGLDHDSVGAGRQARTSAGRMAACGRDLGARTQGVRPHLSILAPREAAVGAQRGEASGDSTWVECISWTLRETERVAVCIASYPAPAGPERAGARWTHCASRARARSSRWRWRTTTRPALRVPSAGRAPLAVSAAALTHEPRRGIGSPATPRCARRPAPTGSPSSTTTRFGSALARRAAARAA